MLIKYSVENFYSFKGRVELDFLTKSDDNSLKSSFGNVAPVAAIFGKNASGKTNILKGINFLRGFCGGRNSTSSLEVISTFLDNHKPTKFEVTFIEGGEKYFYKLVIFEDRMINEEVHRDNDLLLERSGTSAKIFNQETDDRMITLDVPKEQSCVRYIERNFEDKYKFINCVSKFFYCIESNVYHNSFNIDDSSVYNISRRLSKDKLSFALTEHLLKGFDTSLTKIELKSKEMNNSTQYYPVFYHAHNGEDFAVSIDQESSAIKRLFGILPLFVFVSSVGGILVIDELESHFHPSIVKRLIELFTTQKYNSRKAQFVFSTHLGLLMDELDSEFIWLCEKDNSESSIHSLKKRLNSFDSNGKRISDLYYLNKLELNEVIETKLRSE
ncbi:AAA family ATPase [Vibrio splendidus]|uniref:AAA family ATPase n=1 Tax=Vibrio splendidus TaxID=29497 RepID=UPI0006CA42CA|nr:ATP-binding protein [Vibrio splendidus]KPL99277.1 hypothetical protein AN167_14025 [Vibrio splendidus]